MLLKYLQAFANRLSGRILLHLLFWLGVLAFLTFFFGHFQGDYRNTFLFGILLLPIAMGTTYCIIYFLIPRYLLQKRYARFSAYFLFTLIISVWIEMLVLFWALINLADYRYSKMNPLTGDIFFLAVGLYFVVFFSTSIKLLQHWYSSERNISVLKSRQLEAELKLKEAELQLLKGQIHPHFLFNTLNNLYGLALENSTHMPDAIIRLSGLLDALLYRNQDAMSCLNNELKLIEDYIALERLRVEDRLQLDWQISDQTAAFQIAPFLLFPFIENAFKHGFAHNTEKLQLKVCLEILEQQLYFKVLNSIAPGLAPSHSSGGIGLQNVQKRLELLYPGQHQLHISQTADAFSVSLRIELIPKNNLTYVQH